MSTLGPCLTQKLPVINPGIVLGVAVGAGVRVGVAVPVGVAVTVGVAVDVGLGVGVELEVGDGTTVHVGVWVKVGATVGVAVAPTGASVGRAVGVTWWTRQIQRPPTIALMMHNKSKIADRPNAHRWVLLSLSRPSPASSARSIRSTGASGAGSPAYPRSVSRKV